MENNTSEPTNIIYRPKHLITLVSLFMLPIIVLAVGKWINVSLQYHIVYLSAYVILCTAFIVYLIICRHQDGVLEQQHLQWQIMLMRENEEKVKAALQKEEMTKRREWEQRQQDTSLYLKLLEGSGGDAMEVGKRLDIYRTYMEKSKF